MKNELRLESRRRFLMRASGGIGGLAFQAMLTREAARAGEAHGPLAPKQPHFAARASRVIFLNMDGGPSAQETFNPKPDRSLFQFNQHGQAGLPVSELFPHLARHTEKLCLLHGMHSDSPDHINAAIQLHCGKHLSSRPSMGSWVTYGLGNENENLPGFITLNPSSKGAGAKLYGNAFIPAIYAGTPIDQSLELSDARNELMNRPEQRALLDRVQLRNRNLLQRHERDSHLNGLLNAYELAFKMQSALPELLDVRRESRRVLDAYGVGKQATDAFARQCLAARRMSEAGVRFIELPHGTWDHHSSIGKLLPQRCAEIDQPIAALLEDLSQRGLLDETLILWGGEFGRTKTEKDKRDGGSGHNNKGYTMWLAGGGVKGGFAHGQTDEEGWEAIEGRVHIHDLHATMLHQLGLDHERLTYRYAGRDFRLTDVHGKLVREII